MSSRFPYDRNTNAELIPFTLKDDLLKDSAARGYAPWLWQGGIEADVRDLGGEFVVEAELPGAQGRISVEAERGVLTIRVNGVEETGDTHGQYVSRERRFGAASRSFTLNNIDETGITAEYTDGILTIHLPKTDKTQNVPRKIDIH